MKKTILLMAMACIFSSCATVLGGKVTDHQRKIPVPGEHQRKVRAGFLIADVLIFPPLVIVDFATYRKEKTEYIKVPKP
jgi:hypothetical protein